ncbi:MAG: DUF3048 domain-containing protein [Chloroflexi bacterium]|nr:DUF3048 domain-containing protein [Chloroflexota bacterium]
MRKLWIVVFTLMALVALLTTIAPAATQAQGGAINPLTGLPIDPGLLQRRPIAVKIENSAYGRPQSGLDKADVVYESLAEEGVTRFCAIFYSQAPTTVGPVRSARPSDIEILPQYQAALAYSGCSVPVKKMLNESPDIPLVGQIQSYDPYRRIPRPGIESYHTLYGSVPKIREMMVRKGYETPVSLGGWQFANPPIAITSPTSVAHVDIPFSGWSRLSYRYDARLGAYRRWFNDKVHWDRESEQQYAPENVIVQFADVKDGPYVRYTGGGGAYLLLQNLTGEGRCIVLRGGAVTYGKWVRSERNGMTRWLDDSGQPILLNPGRTWIAVVPLDTDVKVTLGTPYTGSPTIGASSSATPAAGAGSTGSTAPTSTPTPTRPIGRGARE